MNDVTDVPIMLDGDTGYGDFNTFRKVVKKMCQRGLSAICIEDKQFPKSNSFSNSKTKLADVNEFCRKLKAGLDTREDENFNIITRVESLIAGQSVEEALVNVENKVASLEEVFRLNNEVDMNELENKYLYN